MSDCSLLMMGERSGRDPELGFDEGGSSRAEVMDRASVRDRILDMGGGGGEVMERYYRYCKVQGRFVKWIDNGRCNLVEPNGTA